MVRAHTARGGWKNKLARKENSDGPKASYSLPSDFRVAAFRDEGISSRMPHLLNFRIADHLTGTAR